MTEILCFGYLGRSAINKIGPVASAATDPKIFSFYEASGEKEHRRDVKRRAKRGGDRERNEEQRQKVYRHSFVAS